MEKKNQDIELRKYFEDKICNKKSPKKRTLDNRVIEDDGPKVKEDFYPTNFDFDDYVFHI